MDSSFSAGYNNYFVSGHSFCIFHIYFVDIVVRLGLGYSDVWMLWINYNLDIKTELDFSLSHDI